MKAFYYLTITVIIFSFLSCKQKEIQFSNEQKEVIEKEVKEQFNLFVDALNMKDVAKWSKFYSDSSFISSIVATNLYLTKTEWVETITKYFSMRKEQRIKINEIKISALSQDLALLTSEDFTTLMMDNDSTQTFKHIFSLIWKKEQAGWKIINSHESMDEIPGN